YRAVIDRAASARQAGQSRAAFEARAIEDVGRRAVEYHEEWFDEPETVTRLLRRMIDADPAASWAFERLKLTYNAAERWDELFGLYDEALKRAPDERSRAFILEEAAEAAKDLASDADRAIGYLEQLLAIRRDVRAVATLERLYERHGKHRALVDL